MTQRKVSIGEVLFTRSGPGSLDSNLKHVRLILLRLFYNKADLRGWTPYVTNPFRELSHEDVNWDTAGERVIGRKVRAI